MRAPQVPSVLCIFITFLLLKSLVLVQLTEHVNCITQLRNETLFPTVFITILARNKEHTLPHYLGYLEKLDYPRDRISLWIRSDHNVDNSPDIIKTWLMSHKDEYHSVDLLIDDLVYHFPEGSGVFEWSDAHFQHIISLKEAALESARKMWADYIFFLDCDVFMTNNRTLRLLIEEDKTVVAPLMETLGAYSNYWCGMTEQGYYKRTDDYLPILEREKIGCFDVPMVHSAMLIDLRKRESRFLSFDPKKVEGYNGPVDDIIVFAYSARSSDIKMYICNKEPFGFMLAPLEKDNTLQDDREQLTNLKVDMMVDEPSMYISPHLQQYVPKTDPDTVGFDQVYLINLERRPIRRERMLNTLSEMGIKVHLINAIDGKALNDSEIKDMGIKMLPEYADPYHKRILTKGEIGCFLSHYHLWKDMIANQHRTALVFEDDLRFEPYFKKKVEGLLKEVQKVGLLWDLIYLGRKRLAEASEPYVQGSTSIVYVDYSYWTLCYLLTLEGAKKLVAANPLSKMVPVDEYFPIMFDRHPETVWKEHYPKRNLRAFSAHPLLVYPTHYTGEDNYVSDTEDSDIAISATVKDEMTATVKDEL